MMRFFEVRWAALDTIEFTGSFIGRMRVVGCGGSEIFNIVYG